MRTSINKQARTEKSGDKKQSPKTKTVKDTGNTFQFQDLRQEGVSQSNMKEAANNSSQGEQVAQYQKMAEDHASVQDLPLQKKEKNPGIQASISKPVVQRAFDAWITEAIMGDKVAIAAAMRNPPEGKTAWHIMLEYLGRLGIADPPALDVQPLIQAVYADVPEPEAVVEADGGARMTDGDAAAAAKANGWALVAGPFVMEKTQSEAGKKHAPKGKVFTDGSGNFWGADNTMHATGAHWKYWTGTKKALVYKGNVTNAAPTTPVERGAQRTMTKATKKKQASGAAAASSSKDEE